MVSCHQNLLSLQAELAKARDWEDILVSGNCDGIRVTKVARVRIFSWPVIVGSGDLFFFVLLFWCSWQGKAIFWVEEEFWKAVAVGSQQTDLFWLSELDSGETRTRRILFKLPLLYLCKRRGATALIIKLEQRNFYFLYILLNTLCGSKQGRDCRCC